MARTLANLRTDLNVKLTDQGGRILTSTQANVLLNEALYEWCARTDELKRETAFICTAKQFIYDAPADMIRPLKAHYLKGGDSPLKIVNEHELQDEGGYFLQMNPGIPEYLLLEQKPVASTATPAYFLRLFPAPTDTSTATTINDAGGISSSDTTVILTSTSNFRSPAGWVLCESEKFLYQNLSSPNLLLLVRGLGGTTAAAHADTTAITQCDFHLIYTRKATALSSDTQIPEIDEMWHQYLVYYALKEALKLDRRVEAATAAEVIWEAKIREASRIQRRTKGAAPCNLLDNGY